MVGVHTRDLFQTRNLSLTQLWVLQIIEENNNNPKKNINTFKESSDDFEEGKTTKVLGNFRKPRRFKSNLVKGI